MRVNDLSFKIDNATQDGRRISVIVNVENHGQHIEMVTWLDFRLIDDGKNLYEDARAFPPDHGPLAAMGEIAPSGNRDFKYVFVVPEGVQMTDCQFVILEDSNNLKYLNLGDTSIGKAVFEPGWKWSTSVKPIVKTESCQQKHTMYVISGKMRVKMDDGSEEEFGPGDTGVVPSGHDAWVVGNEPCVAVDFTGAKTYAK